MRLSRNVIIRLMFKGHIAEKATDCAWAKEKGKGEDVLLRRLMYFFIQRGGG